ncbi:hypothetical protein A9Q99_11035 [Gammaproteobacteria bacterium 45_16_T64]|nr:hypothetical protein A9Q99_11035 [Gammaproteobacteria bacterium 45_16_T64]
MNYKKLTLAAVAFGLITASASSMASGSFSSRGASGAQDPYNFGKITLHKKLLCSSCTMASNSFNKSDAMMVVEKVKNNTKDIQVLSHKERKAVAFYINKRFDIQ